jgi:hypothetical protein
MTPAGRAAVIEELARCPQARLTRLLRALRVPTSVWYHRRVEERKPPGPKPTPIAAYLRERVTRLAHTFPWWGYKRIAVIARRASGSGTSASTRSSRRRACCSARGCAPRRFTKPRGCSSSCLGPPTTYGRPTSSAKKRS